MASGDFLRAGISVARAPQKSARRRNGRACDYQLSAGDLGGVERRMEFLVRRTSPQTRQASRESRSTFSSFVVSLARAAMFALRR